MEYLSTFIKGGLSIVFIIFIVIAVGYLIGKIEIKGISLGTAGVLLVALIYGFIASKIPEFQIGEKTVVLFSSDIKTKLSFLSSLGTAIFVTSIGFIAGPKFFRSFSKKTMNYILLGVIIIFSGCFLACIFVLLDKGLDASMAAGLTAGALTSTPGLSAAKEVATADSDLVTAGYGIAYLFGVLGVVLFVQIMPKILHVDMDKERANITATSDVMVPSVKDGVKKIDSYGLFPFMCAIALGCFIGSLYIPGINFSLGNSGGCLIAGLLFGHKQSIGKIDLRIDKKTLNVLRELGLIFFLTGAGIPGGVNFINNVKLSYFIYGAIITLVPMIAGYFVATKVFGLSLLNSLGAITGGMTSTPALGTLIEVAKTDDVAASYAATYPIALVIVVILIKLIVMFF